VGGTVRCFLASSGSPAVRATARTGTSPADDTRFGSSNTAEVARGVWQSCIYEMPSFWLKLDPEEVRFSQRVRAFSLHDALTPPSSPVDRGLAHGTWQAILVAARATASTRGGDSAPRLQPLSSLARFVNGRAFTKDATGTGKMVVRIAELNSGPGASTVYNEIDVDGTNLARTGDLLFAWSGSHCGAMVSARGDRQPAHL
jgi:hypothetical protein